MFSVIAIYVVLATATAEQLDANTLQGFQAAFYGTIMQHLDAEYQLLQPAIAQQNQSMANCRTMIEAAQQSCESCARQKCRGDIGDWIQNQWGSVTNWFEGAGQSFVDWQAWQDIGVFFGDVGNWFGGAGNSFVNWSGWGDMGNFFSGFGSDIGNFFGNFGNTLSSGFNSFGNYMGNAINSVGSGINSLFGRRRRDVGDLGMTARKLQLIRNHYMAKRMEEISPEARECMQECDVCTPFLGDQTAMIGGVCGDQILLDQAAMADVMNKMKALYDANGNPEQETPLILSMIEYDRSTFDFGTFTCGGVYVTARTPTGMVRYPSSYRYNLQFPQTTANELALELAGKWDV